MSEFYPKILFITVNGWNNRTGTATISSIIDGYPSERVANIFIRSDKPNSPACDKYFRIDEIKVFKSVFSKNIKTGYEVNCLMSDEDTFEKGMLVQNNLKKYRSVFTPFIRDFAWKVGKWKSSELKKFVSDFNPDIVIFPAEGLIHFNKLCLYISGLVGKKTGVFFWDDNFTYKSVSNPVSKVYRFFLRQSIKKICKKADFAFALNPKMRVECERELGLESVLITRPMKIDENSELYIRNDGVLKILYTGSIYIGRGESILKLVDAIKELNAEKPRFFLEIYTNSYLTDEEKEKFNVEGTSVIKPAVTKEEVVKLQRKADILLFTEALSGKHRNAARLSFSTKLTDYFSARRCIFAIAPRDIAPVEYLSDNDIALIADSDIEIKSVLERISSEPELVSEYSEKSFKFGNENHNQELIYHTFTRVVKEQFLK